MTRVHQSPPPKFSPRLILSVGLVCAIVGIPSAVQHTLDQQRYDSAIQAYRKTDCSTATEQFDQVIRAVRLLDVGDYVARSREKKAECEYFQEAVSQQAKGKFETALLNYTRLAKTYDDSALLAPARQQIHELLQKAPIATLSSPQVCNQLQSLIKTNLIPQSDSHMPPLYQACGAAYETDKRYDKAVALYENFLQQYPSSSATEDVKRALARVTVADLKRKGAQDIQAPGRTAMTEDGSTVIEIQNISPAQMRITLSGKTPKFEELGACQDCAMYVGKGPELCPNKGPIGRYTLEPGQYDIAVKFTASDGQPINPWAGSWNLSAGSEYKSCFFVVKSPVPATKKPPIADPSKP